jgi:hypothetical protein
MSKIFSTKKEVREALKKTNQSIEKWVEMQNTSPNATDRGFCEANVEENVEMRQKLLKVIKFWSKERVDMSSKIMRAKEFPVNELVTFNRGGFAKCIAHSETTPSLKYYPKQNTAHCFSCNKHFDSIEIVMILSGKTFLEAVNHLVGYDS